MSHSVIPGLVSRLAAAEARIEELEAEVEALKADNTNLLEGYPIPEDLQPESKP